MEIGFLIKEVFNIVVFYVLRFKDFINYFFGWKVEFINVEDQIFIILMKFRQNYINLYFVQLFSCSVLIIVNIVIIFIYVLYFILF